MSLCSLYRGCNSLLCFQMWCTCVFELWYQRIRCIVISWMGSFMVKCSIWIKFNGLHCSVSTHNGGGLTFLHSGPAFTPFFNVLDFRSQFMIISLSLNVPLIFSTVLSMSVIISHNDIHNDVGDCLFYLTNSPISKDI